MNTEEDLFGDVEALAKGLGFELVEFSVSRHKGSCQARAVIYAQSGTGISECSRFHRILLPRLEVLLSDQDLSLEVSSPGIERSFKSDREYGIFKGRGVRAYSRSMSDWVCGILSGFDGETISISRRGEKDVALGRLDIAKARLDHSQEVL
jgi:ribosome maturation factor RimP